MNGTEMFLLNDPKTWPAYYAKAPLTWRRDLDQAMEDYMQASRQLLIARVQGFPKQAKQLTAIKADCDARYEAIWNALPDVFEGSV